MLRFVFATLVLAILSTLPSFGHAVENGTRTVVSDLSYWAVITRLEAAIKRRKLTIISRTSVRGAERQKKLGIPGNMVIGAFGDEYTTRILRANVAAGIEAPIRFYVTRHVDDKTTTLWYRRPSWVLAPYGDRTGELRAVGQELDQVMETIAEEATDTAQRTKPLLVKREPAKRPAAKPAEPKPKAATPVAKKRKTQEPRKAEGVAKATPARTVTETKPAPKPVATAATPKAAPKAAPKPAPRKLGAPKPLISEKPPISKKPETPVAAVKPAAPVARAAPKPLTPATVDTPQQRAKAPVETARQSSEVPRRPAPTAKRDPDREAISLTPLMLRLQGQ